MVRILLIDYHRLLYSRIDAILSVDKDMALVGVVDNWDTLQKICLQHQPDAVLLALDIVDSSGLDVCTYLQENHPTIKIIVLLNKTDKVHLQQVLRLNIVGAILKSEAPDFLVKAILSVSKGKKWFSPTLFPVLLRVQKTPQMHKLTNRETEVLQLVAAEKTDKQIAQALGITERTVRYHLESINIRLGTSTRTGASVEALRRKLIQ